MASASTALPPAQHQYKPLPAQEAAHRSTARYLWFGGAVGPGKSRFLVEHAFARMVRWPGIPVFIGRQHQVDIAATTEKTWLRSVDNRFWDDPQYGGSKSGSTYTLGNGSSVTFDGVKDWESKMSAEWGLLEFDECSEVARTAWTNLVTRVRWTPITTEPCDAKWCSVTEGHTKHPLYQVVSATNPTGGWIKQDVYDRWKAGTLPSDWEFIQSQTRDNPYLPPDYASKLREIGNETWVQRMIDGDWTAFEGQIFRNYDENIHLWPRTEPIHSRALRYYGGIDVGATTTYAHRTVGLVAAVLEDGSIVVFREYSEQGPAAAKFDDWVASQTDRWGVTSWRGSPEQERYLRKLGSEAGCTIRPASKAGGARLERTNRTSNHLAPQRNGRPRLYLTEECAHLRIGIQAYSEVPESVALQGYGRPSDDAIRRDDDEVDALGYLLEEIQFVEGYTLDDTARPLVVASNMAQAARVSSILARRRQQRHDRLEKMLKLWGERHG